MSWKKACSRKTQNIGSALLAALKWPALQPCLSADKINLRSHSLHLKATAGRKSFQIMLYCHVIISLIALSYLLLACFTELSLLDC